MFLIMFPASCTDLVHFTATVGTIHHARERGHFAHRSKPSSAISNTLHDVESFLINDGFMRALEYPPLIPVILDLFFQFVGFAMSFEIDRVAKVLLPFQNMNDR